MSLTITIRSNTMYQNTINFERNRERQQTEGYIPKGRKLNKTKRGGVKGSFRKRRVTALLTKRNTS